MKRSITQSILNWKDSSRRKPLLIQGARQIGKTWLIDNEISQYFAHYLKVDLEKRRDLHSIFAQNLSPKHILSLLELEFGSISIQSSLIFFDEIQACPNAIMALRYFYEECPEIHIIAAGSLLEFSFSEISIPVGRVQYLFMKPFSFYEYLLALQKEVLASWLEKPISEHLPQIQKKLLSELRNYCLVGGMPEAILAYRETRRFTEAFVVHSELLATFQDDFYKYRPKIDLNCLQSVFQNSARMVGEQINYTKLNRETSSVTNKKSFQALQKAGICYAIPSVNPTGFPLGMQISEKRFKLFFLDIGLWVRWNRFPITNDVFTLDLLSLFKGKLAEQFVAQELLTQFDDVFYWKREKKSSTAEIDFLIEKEGMLYPIEVKSGASGRLRSMHLFLEQFSHVKWGIVLCEGEFKILLEQKLIFLPLYCAGMGNFGLKNLRNVPEPKPS